jgi:hypothetical protein
MLISNISHTHRDFLNELLSDGADSLVIVSPFLSSDIHKFLQEFALETLSSIELITTFKPNDIEQFTKPFQIKAFFDSFKDIQANIKTTVHVDNSLHGKLYIVGKKTDRKMILTSANFTQNGMVGNHEWGILIEDADIISKALEEIYDNLDYPEVTYNQIGNACKHAETHLRYNPELSAIQKPPPIKSDILRRTYSDTDKANVNPQYFLKPIGSADDPITIEEQEDFSDLHQNLHFSKKKPKGVRKGDYVITTAIGAGLLLSYFRVTGSLQEVPKKEQQENPEKARWPWFMEGRNQSQSFGAHWWEHKLHRQALLDEFRDHFPETPVTHAGGFTLGTINMGNDKVRITPEFGEFLIRKIQEHENLNSTDQTELSKYFGLTQFLKNQEDIEVTLFFNEFNSKTGITLPDSAINHRAYWANQKNIENRPWAKAWQQAGYFVENVNQSEGDGWVRFKKMTA